MIRRIPGNVREPQNVVERAIVLAHGKRVKVEDLPEVLDAVGGNRTKAAAILASVPQRCFED